MGWDKRKAIISGIIVKAAFNENFLYSKKGPDWTPGMTGCWNRSFFMTSEILSSALVKLFQMAVSPRPKLVHINWKLRQNYNRQRVSGGKFLPLLQLLYFWYVVLEVSTQQEGPSEANHLVPRRRQAPHSRKPRLQGYQEGYFFGSKNY